MLRFCVCRQLAVDYADKQPLLLGVSTCHNGKVPSQQRQPNHANPSPAADMFVLAVYGRP